MATKAIGTMNGIDREAVDRERRDVDVLMATAPKHYVRKEVWLPIARERQQQLNRPIRYFTLTTADLFDVRLLERAGLIERTQRGYPGVGFCERDDKTYSDIVRALRWCPLSYKGSFEEMALEHSHFEDDFGYDVVNLDFTRVPFPDRQSPLSGTWGAVKRLLEVQRQKSVSFDLFLTFRGSREGTDDESIMKVAELLGTNLESGRGVNEFSGRLGHLEPDRLLCEDYVTFLAIGLPKLLIGEAVETDFRLSRTDVYSYPRGDNDTTYQIVKFAFGLEIPASAGPVFAAFPEVVSNYDARVAEIFAKPIVNVGAIVNANPELRNSLEEDLETLKALG